MSERASTAERSEDAAAADHAHDRARVFGGAARLLSGTWAAQLATLAAAPVLTRLYTPSDFGAFGIFLAATTLLAVLVTGRYEAAIPLPVEARDGWDALLLALLSGTAACALGFVAIAAVPRLRLPYAGLWTLALPLSIWLAMGITATEFWLNRCGAFAAVSRSRVAGALVMVATQLGLGAWLHGGRGLIAGLLAGAALALTLNVRAAWRRRPEAPLANELRLRRIAAEYARFPRYLLAAQVCNSGANHLPTLFFGGMFGAAVAGIYTLANRALTMLDLTATAVGQAFYPQAARLISSGKDAGPLFRTTTLRLVWIAAIAFPIVGLVAPWGFALVFGEAWRESGELARLLLPVFLTRFVFVPAGLLPLIAGRQDWYLYRQIAGLTIVSASLATGWLTGSYRATALAYSIAYSGLYLLDGYFAASLVRRAARHS